MSDDDGDLLIAELLDSSFGSGPDGLPTPAERLTAGRQALSRRHRLGVAATTVAVLAVALGIAASSGVGRPDADGPSTPIATAGTTELVAPSPPTIATPTLTESLKRLAERADRRAHRTEQELVSNQFPASLDTRGVVVVKDGWRIAQRVEEPMDYQPPEASLGVVVTDGAQTRWLLLTLNRNVDSHGKPTGDGVSPSASADDPGNGYSRFEDWLASMVELQGGARTPPLVSVDAADNLQPGPGAAIVQTRPAPAIDGYTTEGDRMAEVRRDGRTWFVVVRGHGTQADVIPVDADVLPQPTFEAFVDHLRAGVASGEGVR